MRSAIDETMRRRAKQTAFNEEHGIVPKTVMKSIESPLDALYRPEDKKGRKGKKAKEETALPTEPKEIAKLIANLEKEMRQAAKDLEFEQAAAIRDRIKVLREYLVVSGTQEE